MMRRSMHIRAAQDPERGFSLIESMIALTILSIGLLAIAGMQGFAISGNVDANDVTLATNLSADIMERIRFNSRNALAYNGIDTATAGTQPPTSQPMARGDYTQWQARLTASGLSNARGTVAVVSSGPANLQQTQVTVTLTWSGKTAYVGTSFGNSTGGNAVLRGHTLVLTTVLVTSL